MTKAERIEAIKKIAKEFSLSINDVANACVFDDFKYAGQKKNIKEEFDKVIKAYSYEGFVLSERNTNYYNHYIQLPEWAAMQPSHKHTYLKYIGEHYDGVKVKDGLVI